MRTELLAKQNRANKLAPALGATAHLLLHSSPPAYEKMLAHPYIRVQLNAAAAKSHTAAPAASNCKALQCLCRLPSRRPAAHPGKRLVHLCAPQPLPPVSRVLHTSAQAQAAGTEVTRSP